MYLFVEGAITTVLGIVSVHPHLRVVVEVGVRVGAEVEVVVVVEVVKGAGVSARVVV